MRPLALPAFFLLLLLLGSAFAAPPDEYPSVASRVFATHAPRAERGERAERGDPGAAAAARAFLGSLDEELGTACRLALDNPERHSWTNVPPSPGDGGARLGDLNAEQLRLLSELLACALSPDGYAKVRDIMLADDRLLRDGEPRAGFGAAEFRIVLFGEPTAAGLWALQLDGHHLALNLTFSGDRTAMSPSFIGTQPAAYRREGEEVVPLRGQVDGAFRLVNALDQEQRARAILSARRGRIAAGPGRDGFVPDPTGLSCADLDEDQRALLRGLLRQYVGVLPAASAQARMASLEGEIDAMVFAWSGPIDNPSDVSYRLQGPSILVEYACQDLGGNPLDHLHSMIRDPKNEYGAGF